MEMKNQELSRLLIDKTRQVNNYCDLFFEQTLKNCIAAFKTTQKPLPFTFSAVYNTGEERKYSSIVMGNLYPDKKNFEILKEQNYLYGKPIMCCSFNGTFTHTYKHQNLGIMVTNTLFLITLETPLKAARQIYSLFEVNGRMDLILDQEKSANYILPEHLDKFNHIIENDHLTTN